MHNLFPVFLIIILFFILYLLKNPKKVQNKPKKIPSKLCKVNKANKPNINSANKTAQWRSLRFKKPAPQTLFSESWQDEFIEHNKKLSNTNFQVSDCFFDQKSKTYQPIFLSDKETFQNQSSFINKNTQHEAYLNDKSGVDNTLSNTLSYIPGAPVPNDNSTEYYALQKLDYFY